MESNFVPSLWSEEMVPAEFENCNKCELHCQRSRIIWGEGNPNAPVMVVLDNPGSREDKEGNPFVCGARIALQQGVYEAGLKAEDLYISYILKCFPRRHYNKNLARSTCMAFLEQQIERQQPKLAICLGNTAVQWFFGDMEAEVKNLRGVWHNVKGIPTLVSYHPMAIRRRPTLSRVFAEDWNELAEKLRSIKGPEPVHVQ